MYDNECGTKLNELAREGDLLTCGLYLLCSTYFSVRLSGL